MSATNLLKFSSLNIFQGRIKRSQSKESTQSVILPHKGLTQVKADQIMKAGTNQNERKTRMVATNDRAKYNFPNINQ